MGKLLKPLAPNKKRKQKPNKDEAKEPKIKKAKKSTSEESPEVKTDQEQKPNKDKELKIKKAKKSTSEESPEVKTDQEQKPNKDKEPKIKKAKKSTPEESPEVKTDQESTKITLVKNGVNADDVANKYPILNDKALVSRFMEVPLTNNQKGRIRQAIRLKYEGTPSELLPDMIHSQIQNLLQREKLENYELRRIRIMYNMLKTTLEKGHIGNVVKKDKKNKKKRNKKDDKNKKSDKDEKSDDDDKEGDNEVNGDEKKAKDKTKDGKEKKKGPKRYVVFIGNLPVDIDEDKIRKHFKDINDHIVDIRIPEVKEGKNSAFAFLEVANEPTYEMALSQHHSMLGTKRIKVLYSVQKNSKVSKAEAKSKSAKLIALKKAGKLVGSIPFEKKRSQRRLKAKKSKPKED